MLIPISRFIRAARRFPDRPAVEVEGQMLTYSELLRRGQGLAASLTLNNGSPTTPLTAIFAYRSATAYIGVIGSLMRGHGYVPLNRTFPVERTKMMLELSGCEEIVVDRESAGQLEHVLAFASRRMLVVSPVDDIDWASAKQRWPEHAFVSPAEVTMMQRDTSRTEVAINPDSIMYLLFTSGSTGKPKGVMVTHANVQHYVEYITARYSINEADRFSQMFDMTFDLSAADMFVAWSNGACVCCPDTKTTIAPAKFIRDSRLTIWFSVPSTAIFMKRLGMLKPGAYPGLRVSMFCGEALPLEVAAEWQKAAPNSVVDNLYGPTELTIACCAYRFNADTTINESEIGCVPIGEPFPEMEVLIADEHLRPVSDGEDGELMMAGPQQATGYWRDQEKTASAFVIPSGKSKRYYRTGDRVRRRRNGPLVYLGRIDHQVKILGHRVELGEIESVARDSCQMPGVAAIPWPVTSGGASGVELFVECDGIDKGNLIAEMAKRLPSYMVPKRVHTLVKFPLNSNGKYDRLELRRLLEAGAAMAHSSLGT